MPEDLPRPEKSIKQIEKEMTNTYNKTAKKYEEEAKQDWEDKKYVDMFLNYLNNMRVF